MTPLSTKTQLSDNFVSGNLYDKYASKNPIVRWIMSGFFGSLQDLLRNVPARNILEVGCGEGDVGDRLRRLYPRIPYRGIDVAPDVIEEAKTRYPDLRFEIFSIYDIDEQFSDADLIVALEVFEHLDDPHRGMTSLLKLPFKHFLISVPREPLWRVLNVARGKYLGDLGNTPGHLNHWSKPAFTEFLSGFPSLEVISIRSPLPWSMALCRKR